MHANKFFKTCHKAMAYVWNVRKRIKFHARYALSETISSDLLVVTITKLVYILVIWKKCSKVSCACCSTGAWGTGEEWCLCLEVGLRELYFVCNKKSVKHLNRKWNNLIYEHMPHRYTYIFDYYFVKSCSLNKSIQNEGNQRFGRVGTRTLLQPEKQKLL